MECLLTCAIALAAARSPCRARRKPADGPLATRWTSEVSPTNALPEYPRPQMVRAEWMNLNRLWDYALLTRNEIRPDSFEALRQGANILAIHCRQTQGGSTWTPGSSTSSSKRRSDRAC